MAYMPDLLSGDVDCHLASLRSPPAAPALLPNVSAGLADNGGEVAGEVVTERNFADASGEEFRGKACKGLLNLETRLGTFLV